MWPTLCKATNSSGIRLTCEPPKTEGAASVRPYGCYQFRPRGASSCACVSRMASSTAAVSHGHARSAHVHAAVYVEDLARDVSGFVTGQEDDGCGDFLVRAEAA